MMMTQPQCIDADHDAPDSEALEPFENTDYLPLDTMDDCQQFQQVRVTYNVHVEMSLC